MLYVNNYIVATLDQEGTAVNSKETALIDIYHKIRPGDPATPESARSLLNSIFFDSRRYDLAKVGRHKMNKKLGLSLPLCIRNITKEDVIAIMRYIIKLALGRGRRWTTSTTWKTSASARSASCSTRSFAWASCAWRRSPRSA